MEKWSLQALDFTKVKEIIQTQATSYLGKKHIAQILPSSHFTEVSDRLQQTQEGMDMLRIKGEVPFGGICYIDPSLRRAKVGGMLTENELQDIASTIRAGRTIKNWVSKIDEEVAALPAIRKITGQIVGLRELQERIDECIDDQGMVKDQASPTLKKVRKQIQTLRERIQHTLNQLLHRPNIQKMLQEPIVTQRHQRYVMPVKQAYRNQFKGIIHDQSSSGATLFIEPETVVLLNNQLHEKEQEEQKEIEKVLHQLTSEVGIEVPQLEQNVQALMQMDVILAKASFARMIKATCPNLANEQIVQLKKARHPLLPADQVVPIDVMMGETYLGVIITGPNTGGKTVTLKTIGLLALMTQAGFPIPTEEGSVMPVFSGIFADIGDEQSIEQSLSTFSSHITHIIQILEQADDKSLVLFDELGAGTDPTEGAALATAILEHVLAVGSVVVATTHYSELKLFAHTHPLTVNASVEFDVITLKPTYKLMIGVPGRSNAFDIAQRLGLPEEITTKARTGLSQESRRLEEMIAALADDKREASRLREEVATSKVEAEKLLQEIQEKINAWDQEKHRLKEKARTEARQIVTGAKKEAESILQEMRSWAKDQTKTVKEHQWTEAKKRLDQIDLQEEEQTQTSRQPATEQELHIDDEVLVLPYNQTGLIVDRADEEHYMVQVGQLKMKVERGQLQKRKQPKKKVQMTTHTMVHQQTADSVRPELDLRGQMVEEAISELDQYLDRALLAGFKQAVIIHGKGTGALRSGIQQFLRKHRNVKSFRLGAYREGGSGVTVVQLD